MLLLLLFAVVVGASDTANDDNDDVVESWVTLPPATPSLPTQCLSPLVLFMTCAECVLLSHDGGNKDAHMSITMHEDENDEGEDEEEQARGRV